MRHLAPLLLLLLGNAPAPAGGTITGTVIGLSGSTKVASPYMFVYLQPVHGAPAKPPGTGLRYAIHQKGKQFAPHVLVIPTGAVVAFPNDDLDTSHNVFSPTEPHFDLGRANSSDSKNLAQQFDEAVEHDIYCDIHQQMWAKVKVVDSPYIAPVDKDGRYTFGNVAPGEYKVVAWAPSSAEALSTAVTLAAGATATARDIHLQVKPIRLDHTRIDGSPYSVQGTGYQH